MRWVRLSILICALSVSTAGGLWTGQTIGAYLQASRTSQMASHGVLLASGTCADPCSSPPPTECQVGDAGGNGCRNPATGKCDYMEAPKFGAPCSSDGNECTRDVCCSPDEFECGEGQCSHPPVASQTPCNGSLGKCDGQGTCAPLPPSCGDGSCNGSETCNTCPADCGACPATCGDGSCNGSETCHTCPADCGACPASCGDGTITPPEQCDDGNGADGDGCSASCGIEYPFSPSSPSSSSSSSGYPSSPSCGDGIQDPGEQCDYGRPRNSDPNMPPGGCAQDSQCAGEFKMNVPFAVTRIADPIGTNEDAEPQVGIDLDWDTVITQSNCLEDCTIAICDQALQGADPTNPDIASCYVIHRYADGTNTCSPFPLQNVEGESYNLPADNALGVAVDLSSCPKAIGRSVVRNTLFVLPQESGKDPEEELHQTIESSEGYPETGTVQDAKKSLFSQVGSFLKYFFTGLPDTEVALSSEFASPLLAQVGGEGGQCLERDNWDKECSVGKGKLYNCDLENNFCIIGDKGKYKKTKDSLEFPNPKKFQLCDEGTPCGISRDCATGGECASGYCYQGENNHPKFCTGTDPCGSKKSPEGTCAASTIKVYPPCCGTARCVKNRCEPATVNAPRGRKPRNSGAGPGLPPVGARNGDDKGDGGVKLPPPWGVPIVVPPKGKPRDPRVPFEPRVRCTSDSQCDCSNVGWCNACGCIETSGFCGSTLLWCGDPSSSSQHSSSPSAGSSSAPTASASSGDSSSSSSDVSASYSSITILSSSSFSFSSRPSSESSSFSSGSSFSSEDSSSSEGSSSSEDSSASSHSSSNNSSASSYSSEFSGSSNFSVFTSSNSSSSSNFSSHCGNRVVDAGEQCDDGNFFNLDGCDRFCRNEVPGQCGNRLIEPPEECDDENAMNGDGCDDRCHRENGGGWCGNRRIDPPEQCDDGNTMNGDGCDILCNLEPSVPFGCGNGMLDAGEECDDGNSIGGDGCTVLCREEIPVGPALCGNGIVETGEQCDDANYSGGDGCSFCRKDPIATRLQPFCGNGRSEGREECDDGNNRDFDGCTRTCFLERGTCGDAVVQRALGEECEPSRPDPSKPYRCGNDCKFIRSFCGNGLLDYGEECDHGGENSDAPNAVCRTDCAFSHNGDGIVDTMEECDDGNQLSGDGCDPLGRKEQGAPSGQTSDLPSPVLADLTPLQPPSPHAPVGNTGPAAAAVMASGAAAGWAWMRRRRRK